MRVQTKKKIRKPNNHLRILKNIFILEFKF